MSVARPAGSPHRENLVPSSGTYPCPYCGVGQRSVGWLLWHIRHGHTDNELRGFSRKPARVRDDDPDKYIQGKYGHMVQR